MDKKTSQTGHRSPVKWVLHKNFQVSQSPVISHPATGHWTKNININTGKSQYSPATGQLATGHQILYQPTFSETHAMGIELTNNTVNNSKRVLLPLEPSNMSDPSVVIEPPDKQLEIRQQTNFTDFPLWTYSRRDQSRSKYKSKKRRRRRSSSTSSSSRSTSSDSRKRSRKSKRSKHSHKKRRRRYNIFSLFFFFII